MLDKNLKYLRNKKRKSQEEIAMELGLSRSTWADYENGKSEPTASFLKKVSLFFDVTLDDLLMIDLNAPLFQKRHIAKLKDEDIRIITITVDEHQKENIEFVPQKAVAGYAQNYSNVDYIKNLPHFHLPKLEEGTYRAFEIIGNSMPPIDEGFIAIGKYVEHYRDLKQGKRYVLALKNEGIVFKRVISEIKKNNKLILMSDNSIDYPPFTVELEDVLEAWEMVSFIGYDDYKKKDEAYLLQKVMDIDMKINQFISETKQN
jgi:transcriptional regulator with XRE-family HTH domain